MTAVSNCTCPLCHSHQTALLYSGPFFMEDRIQQHMASIDGYSASEAIEPFFYCEACGFVFRPEAQSIQHRPTAINRHDYSLAERNALFEAHVAEFNSDASQQRREWLGQHVRPSRMLDVGCSFGLLVECHQSRGVAAVGVDPAGYAVETGRQRLGVDLRLASYEMTTFEAGSFDLICAECVAYYFRPSLTTFLASARHHLSQDGVLYLSVPGVDGVGPNFLPNYVRCLIPYENTNSIFNSLGWNVIAQTRQGFSVGSFGLLLRKAEIGPARSAAVLPLAQVRRRLLASDAWQTYMTVRQPPGPLVATLDCLRQIAPPKAHKLFQYLIRLYNGIGQRLYI